MIRRASAGAMSSWPTWTPSARSSSARCGIVVDDEERAVGVGEPPEGLARALDDAARLLAVAQLDHPAPPLIAAFSSASGSWP